MPDDPFSSTPLSIGAQQMHEVFRAYLGAGFTEDQALRLVALMCSLGAPPPPTDT